MISIIVPVYNVEQYLPRCIESLINQTYTDIEIVLVDDGSQDQSGCICDQYAMRDKRIHVIHKTNGGLSDARNAGMRNASKEYILFVDSDDYLDLDACEKLYSVIKPNVDIIVGGYKKIEGGRITEYICTGVEAGQIYTPYDYLKMARLDEVVCGNLFRKEYMLSNDLFFRTGFIHEDTEIFPRLYLRAKSITTTGNSHYNYVVRKGSLQTSVITEHTVKCILEIYHGWMKEFSSIQDRATKERLMGYLVDRYLWSARECRIDGWRVHGLDFWFSIKHAKRLQSIIKATMLTVCPWLFWKIGSIQLHKRIET